MLFLNRQLIPLWLCLGLLLLWAKPVWAQSGTLWTEQLDSQVTVTSVSPDGQRVALGTRDNQVQVFDAEATELWTFIAENSITGLSWSANGSLLAIASEDRRVYLRDGTNGDARWDYKTSRTVNDVALAADGSLVALTTDDQNIHVLDGDGQLLWNVDRGLGVEAVAIYGTGDNARTVIGSDDGRITIFSREGNELLSARLDFDVKAVAVSRSGARILAGTSDGSIVLLNGANGDVIWAVTGNSDIVDVTMSADATFILAATDRGTIYFLDGEGNITQELQLESPVQSVSVAADGSVLVWGDDAGQGSFVDRNQQAQAVAKLDRQRGMVITSSVGLLVLLLVGATLLILFTDRGKHVWQQQSATPRRNLASVWKARYSYILILPTLIFLLTFNYFPAFSGLYHAFTDWNPSGHSPWVGIENFQFLLKDRFFLASFRNAFILVVVSIVKTLTLPLLVAELIFNLRNNSARYWARTLFVVPIVLPAVVEILVWNNIYDPAIGLLNEVLKLIGMEDWTRVWYGDPNVALGSIIFIGVPWVNAFALLIFYGGLISISDEVLDSSRVDGANAFRRFWSIDLPLVMGQVKLLLILNFINAVQTFELVYLTTGGGPGDSTYVPALELYYMAMRMDRMGVASAIGMILFFIILAGTIVNLRFVRSATDFEA